MEIRRLDPNDTAGIRRAHELTELIRRHDAPDRPARPEWMLAGDIADPPPGAETRLYIAGEGEALGFLHVYLPIKSNRHYAEAELAVRPDRRRQGVGTALLEHLKELARAEDRTELIVVAHVAWQDGPSRFESWPDFLEQGGFKAALTEVDRRLDLAALDTDAEARHWTEAAAAAGDDYELVSWSGRTPEEYLEPLCRMDAMIFGEIPLGDVDLQPREVDVAEQRAADDRAERLRTTVVRTVAVHKASGELAANTVIYAYNDHAHARQSITIAGPRHRGHRLGLLVKFANLRQLRERAPHVTTVWAGNADTNAHMVAINERLGYEPVDARVSYKLTLER